MNIIDYFWAIEEGAVVLDRRENGDRTLKCHGEDL